ncbi:MAG: MMPL family transporter [Acidimicrobiales bacterium]|nr:MMPL family transporter [Acidimicrobiales bacterium]MDG1876261.1 MMPL family transporter [Acidimicrobiales bacterium]
MSTALYRLGRFAARRPWTVLGIWFVIAAIVIVSSATGGKEFEDTFTVPGLDSDEALVLLEEAQSDEAGVSAQIIVASTDADSTIVEQPSQVEAVRADFASLDDVIGVTPAQFSPDGTVALLRVRYPATAQLSVETLEDLKELQAELDGSNDLQIEASGELFFTFEEPETGTGEMIGIVAAIVILLVAFSSVIAMGLPIGTALFGLALGVSAMGLINYLLDIPSWAPQMAAMVGIGVGIDYALFLVTRHREYLSQGMTVEESVGRAVATAGQAVIFAGGTVVIAILGLAVAGIPFMTAAGVATSLVVLIMVVAAVTLLPAFLGVAGHKINGIRASRRRVINPGISPRWEAWGAHVSRHAWKYAVGVTAGLLMLSAPVLALELGFPDDGNLPEDRTERQAFDLTTEAFGVGFSGPLLIAVDTGGDAELIIQLAAAVEADDNIAAVQASAPAAGSNVVTLLAYPYTSPQDAETYETVQRLRADVFPTVVGADQRAHIGGQTASFGDVGNQIEQRLPWFISAVVFLSFFLLTGVFRSPIVALKAAILNLLSIGAAYGVLVMVFQWGWGIELLGLQETVPIVSFIPMFMFAILFGLSMDYEVFLLSRVREEYVQSGNNDQSVIHGIASTARVITSAALIMISVFGGFVLGPDPAIKMVGLGLATAIFVDATIVRIILVPATMKLMGDFNWWIPAWLDRLIPEIDIEGDSALPAPEFEVALVDDASLASEPALV